MKSFTSKHLVFIALSAALMFVLAVGIASAINTVTGTPMLGGLIVNLTNIFILTVAALTLKRFGTATFIALIYSILSIPTMNLGPPGVYKVVIGIILGLIIDLMLHFGSYKKWSFYLANILASIISLQVMLFMLKLLGLPGSDKLASVILILSLFYTIEAMISTWIALFAYEKKIRKMNVISQMSRIRC